MSPPPTAAAPPLSSISPTHLTQFFHHHHPLSHTFRVTSTSNHFSSSRLLLRPPLASITKYPYDAHDPELRSVHQLATDSELYELESILFGPSEEPGSQALRAAQRILMHLIT